MKELFRKSLAKSEQSNQFQPGNTLKIVEYVSLSGKISLHTYSEGSNLSNAGLFSSVSMLHSYLYLTKADSILWIIIHFNSLDPFSLKTPFHLQLDEQVAALHLEHLGVHLAKLSVDQSSYLGVPTEGPFKPDTYRY